MSAAANGTENWMWNAFFRVAEPLVMRITRVTEDDAADESFTATPISAGVFGGMEEDAERWDGMS